MKHIYQILAFLFLSLLPLEVMCQGNTTLNPDDDYYLRVLQIAGVTEDVSSYNLRPYLYDRLEKTEHPLKKWFHSGEDYDGHRINFNINYHEPVLFQSFNTAIPRGANDGPIWQGRGYNSAFTLGASGNFGPLYWKLQPVIGFAQNRAYELAPYEPFNNQIYSYRLTRIDFVQRYGPDTYQWADFGESYVDLRLIGLRAGISNEKVWIGPAVHNPLLFGYNAPGFLHGHISSNGPIKTPVGNFEFSYLYGAFRVSDYFEGIRGNRDLVRADITSVKNLMFSYNPSFADGLSIGASRVFQERWPSSFSDILSSFSKIFEPLTKQQLATEENPTGYSLDNQMLTVFARWFFPDKGLEFYGEYGRNDHNYNMRDFRALPNHHRAYLLGINKAFTLKNGSIVAVNFEMNQHEPPRSANILRGASLSWHPHGGQIQGFTHRGQLVATEFGPGNNVQSLSAKWFQQSEILGIRIARVERHNTRFYDQLETVREFNNETNQSINFRTAEFMLGLEYATEMGPGLQVQFNLDQSFVLNQHHIYKNDLFNTRLGVTVRKNIEGFLR
jgi:hypothetical protein